MRDPRWNWLRRLQRWLARKLGVEREWRLYEQAKYGPQNGAEIVPDEFDDDETCDFTEEDVIT